jgi:hypothetical protein
MLEIAQGESTQITLFLQMKMIIDRLYLGSSKQGLGIVCACNSYFTINVNPIQNQEGSMARGYL